MSVPIGAAPPIVPITIGIGETLSEDIDGAYIDVVYFSASK